MLLVAFRLALPQARNGPAEAVSVTLSLDPIALPSLPASGPPAAPALEPAALTDYQNVAEAAPLASSRLASIATDGVRLAAEMLRQEPVPATPAAAIASPEPSKPDCDPTQSPLYCVYTVEGGDTLSKIATKFGLKSSGDIANWDLLVYSNRPDITGADAVIQPGQKVRIPNDTGVVHVVLGAETAAAIAARFGVAATDVLSTTGPLSGDLTMKAGAELLIKNPERLPSPSAPSSVPAASPAAAASPAPSTNTPGTVPPTVASPGGPGAPVVAPTSANPAAAPRTPAPPTATTRKTGFVWPATGPISSYFGPSHPLGIDIDLFKNTAAKIVATASGTVTFGGGNPCCSYGLYVVVDHGNGYTTLYAHLSKLAVVSGQRVNQGDVLGYGGMTGYATGIHLHFEVHYNGRVIDPLAILP